MIRDYAPMIRARENRKQAIKEFIKDMVFAVFMVVVFYVLWCITPPYDDTLYSATPAPSTLYSLPDAGDGGKSAGKSLNI